MSRRKKLPYGRKKAAARPPTEAERDATLVDNVTRVFTCFTEVANDFRHQCGANLEDLDCDILYNRLALEMWNGAPGRASELIEVLTDYLALRERHLAALNAIEPRLVALLTTPAHDHLDPPDHWREVVRKRICGTPSPLDSPASSASRAILDGQICAESGCR